MKLKYSDIFFLHLEAKTGGGKEWEITVVYASPNPIVRRFFWGKLNGIEVRRPWMLVGDFNCVLHDEERSSNSGVSSCFQSWVGAKELLDARFIGNRFTWNHGYSLKTRRSARLDRVSCCTEWRRLLSVASVRHLSHAHSDHYPLLVELSGRRVRSLGDMPFRFEAACLLHDGFQNWTTKEWEDEGDLGASLEKFAEKLVA